jgi:hypothetical protein
MSYYAMQRAYRAAPARLRGGAIKRNDSRCINYKAIRTRVDLGVRSTVPGLLALYWQNRHTWQHRLARCSKLAKKERH